MAIKVQAKDTEGLETELEEFSIGMNLVDTSAAPKVVKVDASKIKDDHTKRTSYENKDLKDDAGL